MLLPTTRAIIAFTVTYHPCRQRGAPATSLCRPASTLFTSAQSDCEHSITNNNYFLASGNNHDVAVTSNKDALTQIRAKLKRTIFKRRRRNSLPRTIITNRSNIQQHVIQLLSRLGREFCIIATLLLLLYRVVLARRATAISLSYLSLRKFVTVNLTRWVVASLFWKLLTLHSQITAVVDDQSAVSATNNVVDDDWFLRGEFQVNFQKDAVLQDDYLFSTNTTSFYNNNNTAIDISISPAVRIRQVSSDGSCLFHAIGAGLLHDEWLLHATSTESQHPPMSRIIEFSSKLRQHAVNVLKDNPKRQFTMNQDGEKVTVTASSLVQLAADQYGISSNEYLTSMQDESVWGGGPEIIALASELNRQIVVLEPHNRSIDGSHGDVCYLKVRARFGDARFDDDGSCIGNAIYILCANQQFPESRGRGRRECNHFLAVFPFQ